MAENEKNQPNENKEPKPEVKYTQDDFNKAMANKEREVERKLKAKYEGKKILSDDDYEQAIKDAQSKGEKLAQMNAEERAKAERKEREKAYQDKLDALEKRQHDIDVRDALSQTRTSLTDAKLPADFADILSDVDPQKRANNINKFSEVWKKALDEAVDKRVSGKKTPETGTNEPPATGMPKTRQEFLNLSMQEQNKLYLDNPEYVKQHFYNY